MASRFISIPLSFFFLFGCAQIVNQALLENQNRYFNDQDVLREALKGKSIWIQAVSVQAIKLAAVRDPGGLEDQAPYNRTSFEKNSIYLTDTTAWKKSFDSVYIPDMTRRLAPRMQVLPPSDAAALDRQVPVRDTGFITVASTNGPLNIYPFAYDKLDYQGKMPDYVLSITDFLVMPKVEPMKCSGDPKFGCPSYKDIRLTVNVKYLLWDLQKKKVVAGGYFVEEPMLSEWNTPMADGIVKNVASKILDLAHALRPSVAASTGGTSYYSH